MQRLLTHETPTPKYEVKTVKSAFYAIFIQMYSTETEFYLSSEIIDMDMRDLATQPLGPHCSALACFHWYEPANVKESG